MRPISESRAHSFTARFEGSPQILVLDFDHEYAEIIGDTLSRDRRAVRVAPSAKVALEWLRQTPHQLLVVDYEPNDQPSALELVRIVRHLQPEIGVVVTSQRRLSVADTVACFDAGADEYIEKPFHPAEFAARARAILRRVGAAARASRQQSYRAEQEPADPLKIDLRNGTALIDGRRLDLTATEFVLLRELHQARGEVLSYETLNGRVLGAGASEGATRLKSHVSALRQKLRAAGADPDLVRNTRGVGYVLAPPED